MYRLEVNAAVRHIYIYIYVVRLQKVNTIFHRKQRTLFPLYNGRIWSSDYSPPFIAEVTNAWIYTSTVTVMSYFINYKTNFCQKSHKVMRTWKALGLVCLMC